MTDLIVENGTVITQNSDREIIEDGAVAITEDQIQAVGETESIRADYDADEIIDAEGGAVIPGMVNSHTHVNERLQRGSFSEDRGLYDWLYNAYWPMIAAMEKRDYELAATLYCVEAIQGGVTAFVENDCETVWGDLESTEVKLDAYDRSGIRGIYAAGIMDDPADEESKGFKKSLEARNPGTDHISADRYTVETETALAGVEDLIQRRHGTADDRLSIWPSPVLIDVVTTEVLQESYRLAEEYDVMTTAHISEAEVQDQDVGMSNVEYLRNIGYLGERALLGHCVQIDESDVRLLAKTDTKVAHNYMSNMRLATGYAPVVSMLDAGITVGIGTDDSSLNDTINPLSDLRAAAGGHKGYHRDPGVFQAQTALDMATIDGAKSIGRADSLGSIEPGKQADLAIVDMDHPHLTPAPDPVFALVHSAQGFEIDTVVCAGEVVMADREILTFDIPLDELMEEASTRGQEIAEQVGVE